MRCPGRVNGFLSHQQVLQCVRLCDELTSRMVASYDAKVSLVSCILLLCTIYTYTTNVPSLSRLKSTHHECPLNARSTRHIKIAAHDELTV